MSHDWHIQNEVGSQREGATHMGLSDRPTLFWLIRAGPLCLQVLCYIQSLMCGRVLSSCWPEADSWLHVAPCGILVGYLCMLCETLDGVETWDHDDFFFLLLQTGSLNRLLPVWIFTCANGEGCVWAEVRGFLLLRAAGVSWYSSDLTTHILTLSFPGFLKFWSVTCVGCE